MSTSPKRESSPEQRPSLWRPREQREQISEEGKRWLEENAEAIKAWNEWVEKNGLPLAKYRMF
jgi:hypothetical protein